MTPTEDRGTIRAAGGVVVRRLDRAAEVLLVHRPKYGDWSLPKGKLDDGETFESAALREVEEETGVRCRLGAELDTVRYRVANGRPKVVRYWSMVPVEGRIEDRAADHEVDRVRWVELGEARTLLTYPHDAALLNRIEEEDRE